MRRAVTRMLLGVVAVGLAVSASGAAPATAAANPVDRQAWTRSGTVPTFVADATQVYVAADAGVEQARAFFHIDRALAGASATIVVVEASATSLPAGAAIAACPLTSPLQGSGELSAEAAPSADCSKPVPAQRRSDGSWTVDVTAVEGPAASSAGFGLALVPDLSTPTTFHVGFDAARTTVASAAPVPAIAAAPVPPSGPAATAPTLAPPAAALPVTPPAAAISDGASAGAASVTGAASAAAGPALRSPAPAVAKRPLPLGPVSSPPALVVLALAAVGSLVPGLRLARRRTVTAQWGMEAAGPGSRTGRLPLAAAAAAFLVFAPRLLSEVNVYKFGLLLVLLVGAIGLHILVNWTGELSLAHATLVGLPAFAVAKLSADHGLSPIVLLPVGILVGAAAGGLIGVPAVRARGLQVALVTLAAGVAIDRFFFTKTWMVGPASGAAVSTPRLGPFTFTTARSLYPVLAVLVMAAVAVAWALYRSTVARSLLWVKADKDGAAAFGIPVARYRAAAYVLAGAFAGFSGGLTAMWVQRLTPQAFPMSRSFTYLIIVALAGRGFIGGVAAAAGVIEGGRLFLANGDAFMTYAGPVGLIMTLTRYRDGFNGFGRQLLARLPATTTTTNTTTTNAEERGSAMTDAQEQLDRGPSGPAQPSWAELARTRALTLVGIGLAVLGLVGIGLAWYHAGNTSQVWIQNQELISGGIGGLSLVLIGVALVAYDGLQAARAADAARFERLIEALESRRPAGRRAA